MAMKNVMFLFLLFLTGCHLKPPQSSSESLSSSMDAFKFNEQCPHVCWLGINPGITSADQARTLLRSSKQIDREWHQVSDAGLVTEWYPEISSDFSSTVGLQFENGLVKSLYITDVPNTIDDFVKLLGQPEQIRISVQKPADAQYVQYAIYFPARRVMIGVESANWTGPQPTDTKFTIWLNTEFNNTSPFNWGETQPWLGYGHILEYLPGVEIPKDGTP